MLAKVLISNIQKRKQTNLYRTRSILSKHKKLLSFCGNDYLSLANHPEVIAAYKKGLDMYGTGSGASCLLGGYSRAHYDLEEELANFLGYQRTLLFATGYMANLAVITTFYTAKDHIFIDRLSHASMIDGCRYSGVCFERYQHNNPNDLELRLRQSEVQNKLVCSNGLFGMDGDIAPLPKLVSVSKQNNAWLMIDDAHGIGVLGNKGRGIIEHFAISTTSVPILVGTLSKAFGLLGGLVASSNVLIENLIQFARPYIYTTSLPAALAQAGLVSLHILRQENWRREYLMTLIKHFQQNAKALQLPILSSDTPIQLLLIKCSLKAKEITTKLKGWGILVDLIRPPTVPNNTSRIRISLNVCHTKAQIDYLLTRLSQIYHHDKIDT